MKHMHCNRAPDRLTGVRALALVAIWLVSIPGGMSLEAQEHKDMRSVHRSFPVSMETTLEVENKYGKIQVITWEKDSVALDVEIYMTESSASKLRKLKDDIQIDFTRTNTYIMAKTVIESESGRIISELRSIGNTLSGTNKRMEINYVVHLPAYIDVVLNNKFGDIYMDDLDGQVDITLSNGVLKANRLEGNSVLSLSFANGMVKSLGSSTMSLSYSELEVEEVSKLDLESKSSELNVDAVNVLNLNSRRDKLFFKQVEYIYGETNFTQLWVDEFTGETDVYMKYGGITVDRVTPEFSRFYVESEYTDITLYVDNRASLDFNILYHEKTDLRLPREAVLTEESFDGNEHYSTRGYLGEQGPADETSGAAASGEATSGAAASGEATSGEGRPGEGIPGEGASGASAGRGQINIDALQKCYISISLY